MSSSSSVPEFSPSYGAILIGLLVSAVLLGINISQVFTYYNYFPKDRRILKAVVYYVLVMEALRLAFGFYGIYYHILAYWGKTVIPKPTWTLEMILLLVPFTEIAVRLYFAYRVWIMSQRNVYITMLLVILCVAQLADGVATCIVAFLNPALSTFSPLLHNLATAGLALSVTTDWGISLSLIYFLNRNRSGMANTDAIINRIVFYTVNLGLITSCFDICVLVLSLWRPAEPQLYEIALYQVVGNLYANSLLASLNSRIAIRQNESADAAVSHFSAFEARAGNEIESTHTANMRTDSSKVYTLTQRFVSSSSPNLSSTKHETEGSQSVSINSD